MLGLFLHLLHQPRPLDDVRKAGIIFDIGGRHQLPAGLNALDEDRLHSRARAIDRGGEPSGAGTEDEHPGRMGRHVAESASAGRGASRLEAPAVETWNEQARVNNRYAPRKTTP